jgi:DNA mismatch repair protein MutS
LESIQFGKTACSITFLDISTASSCWEVRNLLDNFQPKERLYHHEVHDFERYFFNTLCTLELDDWVFTEKTIHQKLYKYFNDKSLKGFGVEH